MDRETLLAARRNLLHGLDQLAPHVQAGTLHQVAPGKSSPPIASGWLITIVLEQVNAELRKRG